MSLLGVDVIVEIFVRKRRLGGFSALAATGRARLLGGVKCIPMIYLVLITRQDGEIKPLIRSIVDEILGLQREYLRFRRSALGCRALSTLPRA
jgi:hypothetical protein